MTLVSDTEIDALVAKGWDWHAAYRHLQTAAQTGIYSPKNVSCKSTFLLTCQPQLCIPLGYTTREAVHMKIVSVRDKRVKALVDNPELTSVKGLTLVETRKIVEMIAVITVMTHPRDFQAFPQWRAHELKPGKPGKWALMVTGNYRLTFMVNVPDQEVSVMDYEDYH